MLLVLLVIVPALVEVRGEVQALGLCAAWSVCARCDAGGAVDRGRGAVMGGKLRARIRLQASVMPRLWSSTAEFYGESTSYGRRRGPAPQLQAEG